MIAPGPDATQLRTILSAAMRVPDHGKLAPWRFVVVPPEQRSALADLLVASLRAEKPDAHEAEITAAADFAHQAPILVVVLSSVRREAKIPAWEQELSAGAACMTLLISAHALGFVGGWLTTWAAYNDTVRAAFGGKDERIAGFIFIGSPARALEERPRPDYDSVVSDWTNVPS